MRRSLSESSNSFWKRLSKSLSNITCLFENCSVIQALLGTVGNVEAEFGGFFVGNLLLVVILVGSLVDGLLVELDAVILLVVLCVVVLLVGSLVDGLLVELFEIEVGLD